MAFEVATAIVEAMLTRMVASTAVPPAAVSIPVREARECHARISTRRRRARAAMTKSVGFAKLRVRSLPLMRSPSSSCPARVQLEMLLMPVMPVMSVMTVLRAAHTARLVRLSSLRLQRPRRAAAATSVIVACRPRREKTMRRRRHRHKQ
eukprot:6212776-Pleurochrysis_carterae.AAC.1